MANHRTPTTRWSIVSISDYGAGSGSGDGIQTALCWSWHQGCYFALVSLLLGRAIGQRWLSRTLRATRIGAEFKDCASRLRQKGARPITLVRGLRMHNEGREDNGAEIRE